MSQNTIQPDGTGLTANDPELVPYIDILLARYQRYQSQVARIEDTLGSLEEMGLGHQYFGFNRGSCDGERGVWYREWAPGARALFLIGDFNQWNRRSHSLDCNQFGIWEIFLSDSQYRSSLTHGSRVKVHVVSEHSTLDRIPAYIKRVIQNEDTHDFCGQYWQPPPFQWQHEQVPQARSLRIYEAHPGMAQEKMGIGTFAEFTANVLPRIQELGYTAVQLMGVMQHPYYASFGYQVSSFFAVSSYFGTPEDLKELIDTAHGLGLQVFLDLVHSHTIKNTLEGLNEFDGTHHHYFHAGGRGEHWAWDSKLFDYGKFEVLRFLLSNCRFWLEEFKFDGFRFDGVTSMIYLDHGLHRAFINYDDYFDAFNMDEDALVYLQLANQLIHELRPTAVTIAEEVSGLPGTARPIVEGGLGFNYRLAMGIPDYWISLLQNVRDEDWHLATLFAVLTNRRWDEKHIAYCESHDQAMVGDQTLAFRLMGAAMYEDMAIGHENLLIDRGMALHKMIRLISYVFGGDAWLNFMGNEFGHPEWIDFPREGNGFTYHYARRQWSLVDNGFLRYKFLKRFDVAMHDLEEEFHFFENQEIELISLHEDHKLIYARRGKLFFVFNLHPEKSYTGYRLGVPKSLNYRVALCTDMARYGGFSRVLEDQVYPCQDIAWDEQSQSIQCYLPSRSAQVLVAAGRQLP